MSTCKTCRWWGSEQGTDLYGYMHVKVCCCPKVMFGIGNYAYEEDDEDDHKPTVVAEKDGESHVVLGDEAAVMDGSGYAAQLMTGPDFGCIHHEALVVA